MGKSEKRKKQLTHINSFLPAFAFQTCLKRGVEVFQELSFREIALGEVGAGNDAQSVSYHALWGKLVSFGVGR